MPLKDMTPQQFLAAAQAVIERAPQARLVKNQVGNLAIVTAEGDYVGHVDLRTGDVELFAEDPGADVRVDPQEGG